MNEPCSLKRWCWSWNTAALWGLVFCGVAVPGEMVREAGPFMPKHGCLPHQAQNFDEFLKELKAGLEAHFVPERPINWLFKDHDVPIIPCHGEFLEFGVATGATVNWTADYKKRKCPENTSPVYGFDTFTGLPEEWDHGKGGLRFTPGFFSQDGKFPPVADNVKLIKGLFNDTLPTWLRDSLTAAEGGGAERRLQALPGLAGGTGPRRTLADCVRKHSARPDRPDRGACKAPMPPAAWARFPGAVSYIHIDCDLYAGSIQALTLLTDRIHPGTVIVFDELMNYPNYREHEVKALWEWLVASGRRVKPIAIFQPPEGQQGMYLDPDIGYEAERQSAAFIVA